MILKQKKSKKWPSALLCVVLIAGNVLCKVFGFSWLPTSSSESLRNAIEFSVLHWEWKLLVASTFASRLLSSLTSFPRCQVPLRLFCRSFSLTFPKSDFISSFIWCFFAWSWFLLDAFIPAPSDSVLWLHRNTQSGSYSLTDANNLPSEFVPEGTIGRFACLALGTLKSFTKSGLMCTLNLPWLSTNVPVQKKSHNLKSLCENLVVIWPVPKLSVTVVTQDVSSAVKTNAQITQSLRTEVLQQMKKSIN